MDTVARTSKMRGKKSYYASQAIATLIRLVPVGLRRLDGVYRVVGKKKNPLDGNLLLLVIAPNGHEYRAERKRRANEAPRVYIDTSASPPPTRGVVAKPTTQGTLASVGARQKTFLARRDGEILWLGQFHTHVRERAILLPPGPESALRTPLNHGKNPVVDVRGNGGHNPSRCPVHKTMVRARGGSKRSPATFVRRSTSNENLRTVSSPISWVSQFPDSGDPVQPHETGHRSAHKPGPAISLAGCLRGDFASKAPGDIPLVEEHPPEWEPYGYGRPTFAFS